MSKFVPGFNRLLIEFVESKNESIIASARESVYTWAKVLEVGPTAGKRGETVHHVFKKDDVILVHKGAVGIINVGHETFKLLDDDKVLGLQA